MTTDIAAIDNLIVLETQYTDTPGYVKPRDFNSLAYRFSGENIIECLGEKLVVASDTLTFIPAGIGYRHSVTKPSKQIVAHFTVRNPLGECAEVFRLPESAGAEKLFLELNRLWLINPKENNTACMAVFYTILSLIHENSRPVFEKEQSLIKNAVLYMHENFNKSEIQIKDLGAVAHINPSYFRKIFGRIYGCSPIKYLKDLRMRYAKHLLKSGLLSVKEVSDQAGFSSPAYFCREFKRLTGVTPKQFAEEKLIEF